MRSPVGKRVLVAIAMSLAIVSVWGGASGTRAATTPIATVTDPCGHAGTIPAITHVVLILFENHSDNDIFNHTSAANIQALARDCGFADWYHAASHPSLPNYLALTGGEPPAVGDCNPRGATTERCHSPPVPYAAPDLFSSVCTAACAPASGSCSESLTPSYVSCMEGMPQACDQTDFTNTTTQPVISYTVHHNPQPYFADVGTDSSGVPQPACTSFDQMLTKTTTLGGDVGTITSLPSLLVLVPDEYDDMHNGGMIVGDQWLAGAIDALEATSDYQSGSTVIIFTFDEGDKTVNHASPVPARGNCYNNAADDSAPGVYTSPSGYAQSCVVPLIVMNYYLSAAHAIGGSSGPLPTFLNHYDTLYTMLSLLGADTSGYAAFATGGIDAYSDSINGQAGSTHPINFACQAYFALTTAC